ncbi:MAG: SDR family oxidoreductase [candidate division Zixibacteria bacterium]|nr:SDR family oxidoreductase [candidate division Zixibacteria bacterium]
MRNLTGLKAIVTGASKGIGRAIAERLADEKTQLALVARNGILLEERVADCSRRGAKAKPFVCDVGDAAAVERQLKAAIDWLCGVDLLVNNAGLGYFGSVDQLTVAQFDEMISTNLRGVFLCSRAVVPRMKADGGGTIINLRLEIRPDGPLRMHGFGPARPQHPGHGNLPRLGQCPRFPPRPHEQNRARAYDPGR